MTTITVYLEKETNALLKRTAVIRHTTQAAIFRTAVDNIIDASGEGEE